MKKIILIGSTACGKTTILQRINGLEQKYKKTQSIEVYNETIDTPGEYLENRGLLKSLLVTALEAELVFFVQDASREIYCFSPGQSSAFPMQVAGIVTKTDIASPEQVSQAKELLELAGADPVFCISAVTGEGMRELEDFLNRDDPER